MARCITLKHLETISSALDDIIIESSDDVSESLENASEALENLTRQMKKNHKTQACW